MLKLLTILFCAAALASPLFAEEFVTAHSISKQFVVYGSKTTATARGNQIPLDPSLVAVSCERIKQTLLAELGSATRWQFNAQNSDAGKIFVSIHPNARQSVVITPLNNSKTLNYRIDLPNEIIAAYFVEAVTHATLLELANRNAGENFTQIPRWLAQGMSARLQSVSVDSLVLQRSLPATITKLRTDPTAKIRQALQHYEPLTFAELSWPEDLSSARSSHFDQCAELFVHELLRLKNGDACLRQFVEELPGQLNWQFAFLRAFKPHFQQLVDVEKWWTLRVVNLTGRTATKHWSLDQSLDQMESALSIAVQIYSTNTLPGRSEMPLQQIVAEWEPARQKPVLRKAANQLKILQGQVQPELSTLLMGYTSALENYLQRGENEGFFKRMFSRENFAEASRSLQQRLAQLDQQRLALKAPPVPKTENREEAIRSALEVAGQPNFSTARQ